MKHEDAYRFGFRARLAGKELDDNPYPAFSAERSAWYRGWRDQDEHLNSRNEALNSIGWFGARFADGKFHERVMVYQRHVATLSANSLDDLIADVNAEYGNA